MNPYQPKPKYGYERRSLVLKNSRSNTTRRIAKLKRSKKWYRKNSTSTSTFLVKQKPLGFLVGNLTIIKSTSNQDLNQKDTSSISLLLKKTLIRMSFTYP